MLPCVDHVGDRFLPMVPPLTREEVSLGSALSVLQPGDHFRGTNLSLLGFGLPGDTHLTPISCTT